MRGKDFDPAALLIAIIPVAASPLLTSGPWDKLDTVVAVVVLVIISAYSFERATQLSMTEPQRVSVALVAGLISSIACAWPIQCALFYFRWIIYKKVFGQTGIDYDATADRASDIAIELGVVLALTLWIFLWQRTIRSESDSDTRSQEGMINDRILRLEQENEKLRGDLKILEQQITLHHRRGQRWLAILRRSQAARSSTSSARAAPTSPRGHLTWRTARCERACPPK
jgi:hypothetical protein